MDTAEQPVDVISVCSADGQIRPLRLQVENEAKERIRIDIDRILSTKHIPYVGVEAFIFRCRGRAQGHECTLELKYLLRKHSWSIINKTPPDRIDCFGGISL